MSRNARIAIAMVLALLAAAAPASADMPTAAEMHPTKEGMELFEKTIRPALVRHCYECHSGDPGKAKGHFVPIGSQGFYRRGGEKARFDQQPVEAGAAVSACLEAFRATGDDRWVKEAWSAFNWFLGDNDLQIVVYDASTGGCRDGLHPDRANENQGAESTLSFLMALLEMRLLEDADIPAVRRQMMAIAGAFPRPHNQSEIQ